MQRIPPLAAPYPDEIQAHFDAVMPPGAPPLLLFTTLASSPRAWKKFRAGSLLDGRLLSLREREIVIDRVCARAGCEYEWGVHVAAFAAAAGLTRDEIARTLQVPPDLSGWPPNEAALIDAVDALHERASLWTRSSSGCRPTTTTTRSLRSCSWPGSTAPSRTSRTGSPCRSRRPRPGWPIMRRSRRDRDAGGRAQATRPPLHGRCKGSAPMRPRLPSASMVVGEFPRPSRRGASNRLEDLSPRFGRLQQHQAGARAPEDERDRGAGGLIQRMAPGQGQLTPLDRDVGWASPASAFAEDQEPRRSCPGSRQFEFDPAGVASSFAEDDAAVDRGPTHRRGRLTACQGGREKRDHSSRGPSGGSDPSHRVSLHQAPFACNEPTGSRRPRAPPEGRCRGLSGADVRLRHSSIAQKAGWM